MEVILLCVRLFLAAVFAAAALAKLSDVEGTRRALKEFGAPGVLIPASSILLPAFEILIAAALVSARAAQWGAIAALALLGLFSAVIFINLARGRAHSCHCFGQFHSAPISAKTLIRNFILIGMAVLVLWRSADTGALGVESWLFELPAFERARVVIEILAAGILRCRDRASRASDKSAAAACGPARRP